MHSLNLRMSNIKDYEADILAAAERGEMTYGSPEESPFGPEDYFTHLPDKISPGRPFMDGEPVRGHLQGSNTRLVVPGTEEVVRFLTRDKSLRALISGPGAGVEAAQIHDFGDENTQVSTIALTPLAPHFKPQIPQGVEIVPVKTSLSSYICDQIDLVRVPPSDPAKVKLYLELRGRIRAQERRFYGQGYTLDLILELQEHGFLPPFFCRQEKPYVQHQYILNYPNRMPAFEPFDLVYDNCGALHYGGLHDWKRRPLVNEHGVVLIVSPHEERRIGHITQNPDTYVVKDISTQLFVVFNLRTEFGERVMEALSPRPVLLGDIASNYREVYDIQGLLQQALRASE